MFALNVYTKIALGLLGYYPPLTEKLGLVA